jgi:hypothetical protein
VQTYGFTRFDGAGCDGDGTLGCDYWCRQKRRARNVGRAVVSTVKAVGTVAKAAVMIPTQLALHPNAAGLQRAGRRTMDTASTAIRAPTHLALSITRVVAPGVTDALYFIKRQIENAIKPIIRAVAQKVMFKKSGGQLHGDGDASHPIIGMPRATAIASVTAIATPLAATAGAAIGAPVFGVGAGAGATIAGGLVAGLSVTVVNGIYDAFEKAKNEILGRGKKTEAQAAKEAADQVSKGGDMTMPLVLGGGLLLVYVLMRGKRK